MFALRSTSVGAVSAASRVTGTRSYATLKEVEARLKSIKNVSKITSTMKVVAQSRLGKAQKAMQVGRAYGSAQHEIFEKAETKAPEAPQKRLLIVVSSDKGLCGSIHSQLSRNAKAMINKEPELETDIVAVGDKVKAQLSRVYPEKMALSISQIGKQAPTFVEAALVADKILSLGNEYDKIQVMYNKFINAASFQPTVAEVYNAETIEGSAKMGSYEIEDEVNQNLSEFALANTLQWALSEGHAAEIAARFTAMDNASSNASEMIQKLQIVYNRQRQAVITNELVDIITGAASLE